MTYGVPLGKSCCQMRVSMTTRHTQASILGVGFECHILFSCIWCNDLFIGLLIVAYRPPIGLVHAWLYIPACTSPIETSFWNEYFSLNLSLTLLLTMSSLNQRCPHADSRCHLYRHADSQCQRIHAPPPKNCLPPSLSHLPDCHSHILPHATTQHSLTQQSLSRM